MLSLPLFIRICISVAAAASPTFLLESTQTDAAGKDTGNGVLWDLSASTPIVDGTTAHCRLYGDSVYAETIGDFRSLYRVKNDTLTLMSDESVELMMKPSHKFSGFAITSRNSQTDSLMMNGATPYYRLNLNGLIENNISGSGILTFDGVTMIDGISLWCESRHFVQTLISSDTTIADNYVTSRYRWLKLPSIIPLAIQYEVEIVDLTGQSHPVYSALYRPDRLPFDEEDQDNIPSEVIANLLSGTRIWYENGVIHVFNQADFTGMKLCTDVTDIPGNLYIHDETTGSSAIDITIPAVTLPGGKYMVAVSVPGQTASYKQMIVIR